jgi:hypothetical protein
MTVIIRPSREYRLNETLPPIGMKVVSWPWGQTPSLTQWALDQLKYPLGTIVQDVVDGHPVVAQIQTHDSYGAHPDRPRRAHKGTSVYVPAQIDDVGKLVAIVDPPDGWGVTGVVISGVTPDMYGLNQEFGGEWRDFHHHEEWARGHVKSLPRAAVPIGAAVLGGAWAGPPGLVAGLVVGLGLEWWARKS